MVRGRVVGGSLDARGQGCMGRANPFAREALEPDELAHAVRNGSRDTPWDSA
jgi:hypothetical protein